MIKAASQGQGFIQWHTCPRGKHEIMNLAPGTKEKKSTVTTLLPDIVCLSPFGLL